MKIYKKAILPVGFKANAVVSGIKRSGKLDLALFYSIAPAIASCCFTSNKIQAACIRVSRDHLLRHLACQAIIANSGNANCCTGKSGLSDALAMTQEAARAIGARKENILVASTGIIGKRLELAKIKKSIPALVQGLSTSGIDQAKIAIMTTDTFAKEITVKFNIGKHAVSICGIAKGAGMIAPDMATMLAFIFTDAAIFRQALDRAVKVATAGSFNCITVDGCMSTNDSVMVLANAMAANPLIKTGKDFELFSRALNLVCIELAKMIVRDAEGATKFIRIRVEGAANFAQARAIALSIANSNLFKTAVYGRNPNYGRIMAAIGSSGVDIEEKDIKFKVSSLYKKDVFVDVSVGKGKSEAVIYTSDLTPEYIKINAEYN